MGVFVSYSFWGMLSTQVGLGCQPRHPWAWHATPIQGQRLRITPFVAPSALPLPNGDRQFSAISRRNLSCRTLDQEGSLSSFHPSGPNGALNGKGARGGQGSGDTFKQLRQAVLSSLDFSDDTEATQDWDDWEDSSEEMAMEPQAAAAAAGKAVFEVQRIDQQGKARRVYVRRRDLIRTHGLQPRDLRRVDPSLSPTKSSPSIAIKEDCVLVNIGGIRAIITADKCLLFEPSSGPSRKFLEVVLPKLQSSAAAERARAKGYIPNIPVLESVTMSMSMDGYNSSNEGFDNYDRTFPFELEILEAAFVVATGKLEAELVAATRRVGAVLQKLPREITPVNLEELRRVKQLLVELESKAENLRDVLTELMDDEDEVRELNLSSRPIREEKRRQRERERLVLEMEREMTERGMRTSDGLSSVDYQSNAGLQQGGKGPGAGEESPLENSSIVGVVPGGGVSNNERSQDNISSSNYSGKWREGEEDDDPVNQAQDALDEIADKEEEEREVEEVEDLLEYYLQRAATTQSEAERLLAGARDLEESIGVSLSARRFEVNRLELMLSIASFAAALGAMVASIFGMNLRSTLEMSVIGFWGTTIAIVAGSCWVFWVLYKYTKGKRIL